MAKTTDKQAKAFLAINPYLEKTIITPVEKAKPGQEWVSWGDGNAYPEYLQELYKTTTTLRTVILGLADYIKGNGVDIRGPLEGQQLNRDGQTPRELVQASALDLGKTGGFAWQLVPSKAGQLIEVYPLPLRFLRTNKHADVFWYSEEWGKSNPSFLVFQKWDGEFHRDQKTGEFRPSVLYVKAWGDGVYPEPLHAAAIKACETERSIDEFHLGNIERGFMGSYIVSFNNGTPSAEAKKQIERDLNQKFAGARNAGRMLLAFNDDKDHAVSLQKLEVSDYGDKYETLSKHCRQQIFTAFRANPNIFGIPTESLGFSDEEYEQAFKLFNRTIVAPLQDVITDAWGKATGGTMTISPFTLEGGEQASTTQDEAKEEAEI